MTARLAAVLAALSVCAALIGGCGASSAEHGAQASQRPVSSGAVLGVHGHGGGQPMPWPMVKVIARASGRL